MSCRTHLCASVPVVGEVEWQVSVSLPSFLAFCSQVRSLLEYFDDLTPDLRCSPKTLPLVLHEVGTIALLNQTSFYLHTNHYIILFLRFLQAQLVLRLLQHQGRLPPNNYSFPRPQLSQHQCLPPLAVQLRHQCNGQLQHLSLCLPPPPTDRYYSAPACARLHPSMI